MSWRLIFVVIIVALGGSAWGGMHMGNWLVAHAPDPAPNPVAVDAQPMLDANGKPYVAQPPQPGVDGTLGVPQKPAPVDWNTMGQSLFASVTDPSVTLSRTPVTEDQAEQYAAAQANGTATTNPAANQPNPDNRVVASSTMSSEDLALDAPTASTIPMSETTAPGWEASLHQQLQACTKLGFLDQPSCAWAARNKYCEPNHAWGKIDDCPTRPGG